MSTWTDKHDAYCLEHRIAPSAKLLWQWLLARSEAPEQEPDFLQELGDLLRRHGTISGEVKKQAITLIKGHSQTGYVYCIWCRVNSRAYVGQTTDLGNRIHQHIKALSSGGLKPLLFDEAWKRYGINAFTVQILEEPQQKLLLEREIFWQKKLNAVFSDKDIHRVFYPNTPASYREKVLREFKQSGHVDRPYKGAGVPVSQFAQRREVVR